MEAYNEVNYSELLSNYIQESGLSLREISERVEAEHGVSIDKSYISKLKNGNVNPPSDDVSMALARVTGGNAENLVLAGYYEKAPDEVKATFTRYATFEKLVNFFIKSDKNHLDPSIENDQELQEQIIAIGNLPPEGLKLFFAKVIDDIAQNKPEALTEIYMNTKTFKAENGNPEYVLKLKKLREEKSLSVEEAAALINVTPSGYRTIELYGGIPGDTPSHVMLRTLYENAIATISGNGDKENTLRESLVPYNSSEMLRLPVLGSVRAGQPLDRIELNEGYTLVDPDLMRGHEGFALRVKGDSMIGDRIQEGDIVIVVKTTEVQPNEIAVVAVDDDEATLKRVKQQGDMCMLIPSNPSMTPDLYPCDKIKIIGKVVEVKFWPK